MALDSDFPDMPLAFRNAEQLEKLINRRMNELFENEATVEMEQRLITQILSQKGAKYSLRKLVVMANRLEASVHRMERILREGKKISHRREDRIRAPLTRLLSQIDKLDEKTVKAIERVRTFLAGI